MGGGQRQSARDSEETYGNSSETDSVFPVRYLSGGESSESDLVNEKQGVNERRREEKSSVVWCVCVCVRLSACLCKWEECSLVYEAM